PVLNGSTLDTVLTLYRETGSGTREIVARNDNYDGRDSFIGLQLDTGTYYIAVTSTGNTAINPEVSDSGYGGRSDGDYQLKLGFVPTATAANTIVDTSGTLLDGDRDGKAGGAFRFWFNTASVANTLFVDKATATAVGADGTVAKPYKTVQAALAAVVPTTRLIRIVGNAAGSGGTSLPYLIGTDLAGRTLSDGGTFNVPAGVTVMIDEGAVLKLRAAVIDVGSSSPLVSRAGAALQVLGTPTNNVLFTSYHDDTVGGNSDGIGPAATGGQWGGIALRSNSDSATKKVFLNSISQSQISYGGGQVFVDSQLQVVSPIQLESTRPTLAFNTITKSSGAAISADPNSFEDSDGRSGPELRGNRLLNNSINGLFVRIRTEFGSPVDKLDVSARFKSTDIVYVLQENLFINGGVGGYEEKVDPADGLLKYFARKSGRLTIDPGVVVKLQGSRIELERGTSQLIAEGTADRPVIFTSLGDNRFGGGGTFDTNGALSDVSVAGDWGGIFLNAGSSASIDRATIAYGGGQTPIEGTFDSFNVIETHQGDLRVAHSRIENNAAGASSTNRVGRGGNAAATIFVRGAQPIIVSNDFRNNLGAVVSVNANSLTDVERPDSGRSTGAIDREPLYDDNVGPLVRGNRLSGVGLGGMQVRGEEITVQSVWDDADIVYVLQSEIIVQNFHTATGIRLQSQPNASLIVKLDGPNAGFTAAGYGLDINDRIGGTVQVVGQPGYPVVLTSLKDDSVGASLDPLGLLVKDTNNDGTSTVPAAGDWRSLKFLPLSNDRNVSLVVESEKVLTGGVDVNGTALLAQSLGVLAPNFATGGASTASAQEKGGDDNRRLGFEVHGRIASDTPSDVDVYSFVGYSGSEAWIDIDKTSPSLNAMVEVLDASGKVLALSADSLSDATLTSLTKGIGLPLAKDSILGADFYSQNSKDPGMRVVLPSLAGQPIGTLTQYYIRVRSQPKYDATTTQQQYETDLRDSAKVGAGESAGRYELRVRLQQRDEVPGSTVRYADIRYPTIGIDVLGLPSHSPLTGENGENSTDANNAFASAQYVGNLLQVDQNTISIAGAIASASDVDWYTFALNFEQIQSIRGVNGGGKTWATVFDIDYGDGFRGDLTLSVFDSTGRLMYVGRDSNVAADQPAAGQGNNFNDLSRGSLGKLDPFIGSVQMPAGNPTGSGSIEDGAAAVAPDPSKQLRYYVAVSSNEQLPSALDATFKASATNSLIRLEPVNSVTRVVEDHIGFTGYHSGESVTGDDSNDYKFVAPSGGPMFDLPNLKNQISPFTFNDVGVYLSSSSKITPGANDLMMRSDGKLYSYTGLSGAANTAGRLEVMDLGTGVKTLVGDDSIPDRPASTSVTETHLVPPTIPPTTATTAFGLATKNIILSTFTGVLQYTTTLSGDTTPTTGTWTITSDALGKLAFLPFGGVINLMPQPGINSTVAGNGAVQVNWTANGGVGQVVALGVELVTTTYTFTPDPNSITTDLVDALAW
ncbi:MAG: cell surface protein, partial [Planctomycetota bacterium]